MQYFLYISYYFIYFYTTSKGYIEYKLSHQNKDSRKKIKKQKIACLFIYSKWFNFIGSTNRLSCSLIKRPFYRCFPGDTLAMKYFVWLQQWHFKLIAFRETRGINYIRILIFIELLYLTCQRNVKDSFVFRTKILCW